MSEKLTREEKKRLKGLEKNLGYGFKKKQWLKNALTHKSYANERKLDPLDHNERLEFLGDAVLELVVSHLLMDNYPEAAEGELSKVRASIVNETTLASVAKAHALGEYLYLGKGEEIGAGREKPSLLANGLEAVLGAIYLDRGFKKAYKVIKRIALELFQQVGQEGFYKDYKTQLQEKAQILFKTVPKYKLVAESGPDHDKTFQVNLTIRGELMGVGTGKSKKGAEQNAAREALSTLDSAKADPAPADSDQKEESAVT